MDVRVVPANTQPDAEGAAASSINQIARRGVSTRMWRGGGLGFGP
jgi:hypothetical protein